MTYFYDGGKQGFLTALALSFRDKDAVLTAGNAQLSLGQQTVFVSGDPARAPPPSRNGCSLSTNIA